MIYLRVLWPVCIAQYNNKVMQLPLEVYEWLVAANIITNSGEQDEKGSVALPPTLSANFDNGFLVGEIVRKLASDGGRKVPSALSNVKADPSKNAKLTNWNFIWLAFDAIGLKLETRIKELILQGEQALVVEVLRRLYERDEHRPEGKIAVRMRSAERHKAGKAQAVDIKKINLTKDPEESESSLEFLMLLLKASLGMNLEEILGLFTNQNKYLAHIIVKGLNDSFDSIVLFYSLLIKHARKLRTFHEEDPRDAQACLYALKPAFISKSQQVAELALELFSQLGDIYQWFIGDGKCAGTLLLGLKRHPPLRELYWHLLLSIIEGEQVQFFANHFVSSFQSPLQQVEVTGYLLKFVAQSFLGQKLSSMGVVSSWVQSATKLPQDSLQAQVVCFRFVGQLMTHLPSVAEQNEQAAGVFERSWYSRTLPEFAILLAELVGLLERLGQAKSVMARRVYLAVVHVASRVGAGDKRDFLVDNFLPLIPKFPAIPAHILIPYLRRSPLSSSEYLLVCESMQACDSIESAIALGTFLKALFLENPLLNFNLSTLLKEVAGKVSEDEDAGANFIDHLLEQVLALYGNLQVKYRPRGKQQQSMYFGRKGSPEKVTKDEQVQWVIKYKWKQVLLSLVLSLLDLFLSQQKDDLKELVRTKLLNCNSNIRLNNHKVGSKTIQDILAKKFGLSKQQQLDHSQQFSLRKASSDMDESRLRKSKEAHSAAVMSRLKGPQSLTREFQLVAERRKQEEQEKKALQLKQQLIEERKKVAVKKEAQLSNLLRGQVGEAQLRQLGFLERLVVEPRGAEVIALDQLQERQVEAITAIFKNYHKVLRHLFLTYTWTMYNSHSNQRFEDNQQRKETLNAVELGRMLKDYRLAFLTSQPQLCSLVRDINVRLLGRREVNELDYNGFEQFVIQFCAIVMPRNHAVTTLTPEGASVAAIPAERQPLHALVSAFFAHLKNAFLVRGQKVAIFEDTADLPLSKEQAYEVQIFNRKLQAQPAYILPKGYKKIAYHKVEFQHVLSSTIGGLPEAYIVAVETLDSILADCLGLHFLEDLAVKRREYRVKPTSMGIQGFPRQRAMSTFIDRKSTGEIVSVAESEVRRSSTSRVAPPAAPPKEDPKPRKSISVAKLQELERARFQALQRRAREKEEERQAELERQKSAQRKRRAQIEKYQQDIKIKMAERSKKQAEERAKRVKQEQQKEALKRDNKEKFKAFHQSQLEKIKRISQEAADRQRRQKEQEEEERERQDELRRRLREKLQDKRVVQLQKEAQKKMRALFQSEPIKRTLVRFQPNLKALFDFLVQNTYLSLTERKHNNQIVFDTWRYFITAFDLAIIVHPKDTAFIFKSLTKDKIVPKEYLIGLSFEDFQQALLRVATKHKAIFNLIAEKIKDKQPEVEKPPPTEPLKEKKSKKAKSKNEEKAGSKQKEANEIGNLQEINIKELVRQARDLLDQFADITNVTDRTLLGLIYYLKVPNSKYGQEKRFREILANKQSGFAHNAQRLKEKLNEEYTLEVPEPKPRTKSPPPQSVPPHKLLK